jgi:pseudouridylate synthase
MSPVYLSLSPEVEASLAGKTPIVALESTIIAHGMPYPRNVETALRVEQIVRDAGAVPATCAILNGVMRAGLTPSEIDFLGKNGQGIPKVSRRDMPWIISQKQHGATTVASTMIVAHLAGIRIFATGGIGGVHRGATQTMDISADLQELAQTPVAVVSAGAKSILDIGLTLEYLETMGVPVLGYQTPDFPAFYARTSGFQVDYQVDSAKEIADLLRVKWTLDAKGGVLIANPVPQTHALPAAEMEQVIEKAVKEAAYNNIKGKALTPFLLAKIEQITAGNSLATNIELVCNNARLAAEIAVAYTNFT